MFKNIYKNKRVLVTGHTGFKGSWLSLWLKMLGADVSLGEEVKIRYPEAVRPWQHVLDLLGGYPTLEL